MSDSTPPSWPIHNVKLSDEQISDIVSKVYTGSNLSQTRNLGKNKSFNNRIYFVHIDHTDQDQEAELPEEAVLKVNGRFFGSSKVQNEVACLLLLQRYCPDIPAPRVLAWSEDGSTICSIRNGVFAVLYDEVIDPDQEVVTSNTPGWILTSKLPGRILQAEDLTRKNENLVEELAGIIASWRTNIPHRTEMGNLALQSAGYMSSHTMHGLEIKNGGLILCDTQPLEPLNSSAAFYTHLLSDQMHKLENQAGFAYARARLLQKLRYFRDTTLLQLLKTDDTTQQGESIFTQQDFAPRNVLVEESEDGKLYVSGIMDFEFSGLFPAVEEFLTCRARQADDWPVEYFKSLCAKLAEKGVKVPGYNVDVEKFDILCDLAVLTENVAPWWLQDGLRDRKVEAGELEAQLSKTCQIVEDIMVKYQKD